MSSSNHKRQSLDSIRTIRCFSKKQTGKSKRGSKRSRNWDLASSGLNVNRVSYSKSVSIEKPWSKVQLLQLLSRTVLSQHPPFRENLIKNKSPIAQNCGLKQSSLSISSSSPCQFSRLSLMLYHSNITTAKLTIKLLQWKRIEVVVVTLISISSQNCNMSLLRQQRALLNNFNSRRKPYLAPNLKISPPKI